MDDLNDHRLHRGESAAEEGRGVSGRIVVAVARQALAECGGSDACEKQRGQSKDDSNSRACTADMLLKVAHGPNPSMESGLGEWAKGSPRENTVQGRSRAPSMPVVRLATARKTPVVAQGAKTLCARSIGW